MALLTLDHSMAGDIRLHKLPISGSRSGTLDASDTLRRHRAQIGVLRALRAVAYTAAAVLAIGGLPMICAVLYDGAAMSLLFSY
jgi:hypothetical protein